MRKDCDACTSVRPCIWVSILLPSMQSIFFCFLDKIHYFFSFQTYFKHWHFFRSEKQTNGASNSHVESDKKTDKDSVNSAVSGENHGYVNMPLPKHIHVFSIKITFFLNKYIVKESSWSLQMEHQYRVLEVPKYQLQSYLKLPSKIKWLAVKRKCTT